MEDGKIKTEILYAALAGLLQDVWKFAWLAQTNAPNVRATPEEKNVIHQSFLSGFVPGQFHRELQSQSTQGFVQKANELSETGQEDENSLRLRSIFSRLADHNKDAFIPLARLNPKSESALFPQTDIPFLSNSQPEYAELWKQFGDAAARLKILEIQHIEQYLESMLALLQEFTWCLPHSGDVSLFNYMRVNAAISACLASDASLEEADASSDTVCLLVWGDISGLQKFIYQLASEGAAKSLRARSFYVQLLSEALTDAIRIALGLPITNIIYVGGGGFQMLLHTGAEQTLQQTVRNLTERLLAVHQGELGLTVEWEPVTASDFKQFSKVYDRLGKKLNIAKRRPFAKASSGALFGALGQPLTLGGDPLRYCVVTGEDGKNLVKYEKNSQRYKSKFVESLEDLGRVLPKAAYVVLKRVQTENPVRAVSWDQALHAFGWDINFLYDEPLMIAPNPGEFLRIWQLDSESGMADIGLLTNLNSGRVISYRPFARLTPTTTDQESGQERPLTFDELARRPVQLNSRFERWGVLRMDVDNLGALFRDGFKENASLARIAGLSFSLRLFFEGHLPSLANGKADGDIRQRDLRDYLYVQYSGGDDVFVVGAWDALAEFARRISEAFARYAVRNPKITLSGGLELFTEKYPLHLAAQEAGEAEDEAKAMKDKNAFSFLGAALYWTDFDQAQTRAYELAALINRGSLTRAVIQSLLMFYAEQKDTFRKKKIKNLRTEKGVYGRWMWLAAYQLSRVMARLKRDEEATQEITKLEVEIASAVNLTRMALSARWAQFLTRTKGG